MIEWFAWVQVGFALLVAVLSLINFGRKMSPNDLTLGGTVVIALLLIAQGVVAVIAPLVGNVPTGDLLEFWLYLITALLLPIGAAFWALTDRSKWSNLILAIVAFSVAVMVYRMLFIWTVQIA